LKVTEERDGATLTALRSEWEALTDRVPGATVYQTWEWNDAWWQAYRARKRLRLLLVHDGPELVAIVPLYVSRHFGTPLRRLAFIGTGASDYLDAIVPPEISEPVCSSVFDYLARAGDHDLADLQQLAPGSPILRHMTGASAPGPDACRVIVRPLERCPYLELPETCEAFTRAIGKRLRSNIGYYERLLARTFPDAETRLASVDELGPAMGALFDLHGRRWRMRMMPGVLRSNAAREFHRDVSERFQKRGWLRLHVTRAGGAIVASLYCFAYRERYYYYLGGFEPSLGKLSIGTTLTASAIRQAIAEGCREFDFLRGHEAYKYRWGPRDRENAQCLVARSSSMRSSAMLKINELERYVERRAKAISDRASTRKTSKAGTGSAHAEGVQAL